MNAIQDLQKKINYNFKNEAIITKALTHSSYANENKVKSNETLEFLGDSILNFIVAEYLYSKYKKLDEGELSKLRSVLVCEHALYAYSTSIGLDRSIRLGRGELKSGRKKIAIVADAFEALIAAIYLDGGMTPVKSFVLPFIENNVDEAYNGGTFRDYKTALQEIVQKNHGEKLSYKLVSESGPAHDKTFVSEVLLNSNVIGKGSGKCKKEAEQSAAKKALELMGI